MYGWLNTLSTFCKVLLEKFNPSRNVSFVEPEDLLPRLLSPPLGPILCEINQFTF